MTDDEFIGVFDTSFLFGVSGVLLGKTGFCSSHMDDGRRMVMYDNVSKVEMGKGYVVIQLKMGTRISVDFGRANSFVFGLLSSVVEVKRRFNLKVKK